MTSSSAKRPMVGRSPLPPLVAEFLAWRPYKTVRSNPRTAEYVEGFRQSRGGFGSAASVLARVYPALGGSLGGRS
jgi:hypothetical protein